MQFRRRPCRTASAPISKIRHRSVPGKEAGPSLIGVFGGDCRGDLAIAEIEHDAIRLEPAASGTFAARERGPMIDEVLDFGDRLRWRRNADRSIQPNRKAPVGTCLVIGPDQGWGEAVSFVAGGRPKCAVELRSKSDKLDPVLIGEPWDLLAQGVFENGRAVGFEEYACGLAFGVLDNRDVRGARLLLVTPINRSAAVFATEGNGGVLHQPHTLRMNTGLFGATASRSWRFWNWPSLSCFGSLKYRSGGSPSGVSTIHSPGAAFLAAPSTTATIASMERSPEIAMPAQAFLTLPIHVGMPVEKPRHGGAAAKIDRARVRRDIAGDFIVGPDHAYSAVRDRDRRGDAGRAIEGQ